MLATAGGEAGAFLTIGPAAERADVHLKVGPRRARLLLYVGFNTTAPLTGVTRLIR